MNIVCIDIDSLRYDHISAYGYATETTPNIDQVSDDGVRFERAYVANSPCMPSRAGLMSGRYGISNGIETHGPSSQLINSPPKWRNWVGGWAEEWEKGGRKWNAERLGASRDWLTLPALFFHKRITTGAVSSFPRHPSPWFYDTYHEFHQPQEPDAIGEYFQTPRAQTVTDIAIDFVKRHSQDDFYLYAQFWDPHAPFNRSNEEIQRFNNPSLAPYPTDEQIATHREWEAWKSATQVGITDRADLKEMIAHYDAEIHYMDRHVGRLIRALEAADLYDDALILITADHGEEFGEHGVYREHWSTHEGTQHVPLIIKPPADTKFESGARERLVTNVDIPQTFASYAGLDAPNAWQGESLRPIIEDAGAEWRDAIVFDHGLYTAQRAVQTDQWKFVRTYHPGFWDKYEAQRQLYNIHEDPWEQDDLSKERPAVAERLETRMATWAESHVGRDGDPLRGVARDGPPGYEVFNEHWETINDL